VLIPPPSAHTWLLDAGPDLADELDEQQVLVELIDLALELVKRCHALFVVRLVRRYHFLVSTR
jgi:hypothetical protein